MTLLATAWAFLKGVPREVWYVLAAGLALYAYGEARHKAGESEVRAEWAEATRKAVEAAREADSAAGEAVTETINEVEAGNAQARDAASGSDDPLAAGLNSLRNR